MDSQSAGRAVHALAALRDTDGDVAAAAARLEISEQTLLAVVSERPQLFERTDDGRIRPSAAGLPFCNDRALAAFRHVNW